MEEFIVVNMERGISKGWSTPGTVMETCSEANDRYILQHRFNEKDEVSKHKFAKVEQGA